ncbi:MAG TPA: thiamine diphosphokinase [Chloroflexia bacterium]|nr:thiamine diphosphokinase [Chloroflexia bacterium]
MSDAAGPHPCVWVLASGPAVRFPREASWVPRPDFVIAADGGSSLALELGLEPDLVIGDLDSSDAEVLASLEARGTELRRYDHDLKLETDTELALYAALEREPERIILLGALGGRLDHALANVLMLSNAVLARTDLRIVDGLEEAYLGRAGNPIRVAGRPGETVSILPLSGTVRNVRLAGFVYPLDGENLVRGTGHGVSNRLDGPVGEIVFDEGLLLVVHTHLPEPETG